jgi:hypothetical protein
MADWQLMAFPPCFMLEDGTVAHGYPCGCLPNTPEHGAPTTLHYTQDDYNVALGIGMLAGLLIGGAAGVLLCAILVRVLGI